MKKIYSIIVLVAGLLLAKQTYSQCTVIASANPYTICYGDSTQLTTTTTVAGTYYAFDFNTGTLPPGWSITGGASFDTLPVCAAPSLDNSPFYWSSTSTSTPTIETSDLNVVAGGTINFDFRFKGNSSGSPCETADQYNEGVVLEYSTNSGGSWNIVVYFCSVPAGGPWAFVGGYPQTLLTIPVVTTPGNGNGSCGIFDNWANYVIPIPPAAMTTSTRFRWRQPNSSGSCCDNWGLDNINIAAQPNLFYIWENGLTGFGASSQYITNVQDDTCLTVIVNDTTSGYICLDTVCITVQDLPNLVLAYSNPYCVGDLVTFDAALSDPGITNYQYDLDDNGSFEVSTGSAVYPATGAFTTAGNYNITFQGVTSAGCAAQKDTVVQVYNNPVVNLTALDPTLCIYQNADFNALAFLFNASGQTSTITNYAWDFNNDGITDNSGAALTTTNYDFSGLGNFPVTVTVTSSVGCSTTDTVVVTYVDVPQGNIVNPSICANEFANFSFNNTGDAIGDYTWDFGTTAANDTSDLSTPSFGYPGPGGYVTTLIATTVNGCVDTFAVLTVVDQLPAGNILNYQVCQGHDDTFNFNQTSTDNIVSYAWTFPSGAPITSTDSVPTSTFNFGGPTTVSVIITNEFGCLDTITQPYIVRNQPVADFGVYPICISRFTFDPQVVPDSGTVVIDWNMGDGTVLTGTDTSFFNYLYYGPGDYNVSLVITDQFGCQDSITQVVSVDTALVFEMPNVLKQSSSAGNDKIDMEVLLPGFNLCMNYTYTIYDRWGVMVFETENDPYNPDLYCSNCFQGKTQDGNLLSPGVYYYIMKGNFEVLKAGYITIFE